MSFRIPILCVSGALALLAAAPAFAASKPQDAITGVWMVRPEYYVGAKLSPQPELTPAAEARRKLRAAASAKGYVRSVSNMLCEGGGGPSLFMVRSPFEVFSGFGRVTFIFETETFNQPRTVYLRETAQPADIFPSANGHSIGHWEGETLVVDTTGLNDRGALLGGIQRSDKAHIVERFTVSPDGKTLADEVRMEDPVVLAKPWTVKLMFDRQPDTEERFEVACDVDLDAFATVDLKALAGADPEVDRLLDPDRRGTDPALKIAKPETK